MCNIVLTVVCTVELDGEIEVDGNSATYSLRDVGTGITNFICKLDGNTLPDCMSINAMKNLQHDFVLQVQDQ